MFKRLSQKTFAIFLVISCTLSAQNIKDKVNQFINESFGFPVSYSFSKYNINEKIKNNIERQVKQRFNNDFVYLYKITSNEKIVSLGVLDNVYGKAMPITFMVLFDLKGKIISTNIIKYREQYGGAVSNKEWLNQFKEKNYQSGFATGKDISGISGATISVKSVSAGINKLSLLIDHIIKNNEY